MLSGLLVAAPLGVVVGYSMTSVCVLNHGFWKSHTTFTWYQSFRLQFLINMSAAAILVFIPQKYLDLKLVYSDKK